MAHPGSHPRVLRRARRVVHLDPPAGAESRAPIVATLRYWREGPWYVGVLQGVPDVFSQGRTLRELIANIHEVWALMLEERPVDLRRLSRARA